MVEAHPLEEFWRFASLLHLWSLNRETEFHDCSRGAPVLGCDEGKREESHTALLKQLVLKDHMGHL